MAILSQYNALDNRTVIRKRCLELCIIKMLTYITIRRRFLMIKRRC